MIILSVYGMISDELYETIHSSDSTAFRLWEQLEIFFCDNAAGRAVHIDTNFRATIQGDMIIAQYCRRLQQLASAMADVGEPVSDRSLRLQLMRGLSRRFRIMATLLPMQQPFPHLLPSADKIFEKVINPYLVGVLQQPQSIEMCEGMLHIRDVEGPKKTRSMEARLETMNQHVFKCQGMVESGLNTNHMMITEFTSKHRIDANDIGKHLSRLYVRIDHLQAQIYDPQNQNYDTLSLTETPTFNVYPTNVLVFDGPPLSAGFLTPYRVAIVSNVVEVMVIGAGTSTAHGKASADAGEPATLSADTLQAALTGLKTPIATSTNPTDARASLEEARRKISEEGIAITAAKRWMEATQREYSSAYGLTPVSEGPSRLGAVRGRGRVTPEIIGGKQPIYETPAANLRAAQAAMAEMLGLEGEERVLQEKRVKDLLDGANEKKTRLEPSQAQSESPGHNPGACRYPQRSSSSRGIVLALHLRSEGRGQP
ncbi:40S ribosomal protein S5-1 [Hordeum vulgare]|nr:40S ribosomal protein S5-1 [Hordeum vulgare]